MTFEHIYEYVWLSGLHSPLNQFILNETIEIATVVILRVNCVTKTPGTSHKHTVSILYQYPGTHHCFLRIFRGYPYAFCCML